MAKGIYQGFYDNSRILNALDADGKKPKIFFVVSRGRSLGKTYSFVKTLWERFEETGEKFILLTRRKKELGSVAMGVMKGYLENERPDVTLDEKQRIKGTFSDIYANIGTGEEREVMHCGYVIPLAAADDIKKISSLFVDAWCIMFDEFQPSALGSYLPDEVDALIRIHTSVARGGGKSIRYVPIFMLSNAINIFNPYFIMSGMVGKIQSRTRVYKGSGYIYERCMVVGKAEEQRELGLGSIFSTQENNYEDDNSWMADNGSCVCKPNGWGDSYYICTLINGGDTYAVRFYHEVGMYYVDRKADKTSPQRYNVRMDGNLNIPFIKNCPAIKDIKNRFMSGQCRFADSGLQQFILELFV